jgi:hypothetical protein
VTLRELIDLAANRPLEGRLRVADMDISIENQRGSVREGVDKDGHHWRVRMKWPYGYIRRSEGTDGDQVDVYIGPNKKPTKVYIIHQNNPTTGRYDEDKVMLGWDSAKAAKKAYLQQYDRPGFYGSMTVMGIDKFKDKVVHSDGHMIAEAFAEPPRIGLGSMDIHIDVTPKNHPPSLSDPQMVPADTPQETDDRFLDVTKRNEKGTQEFRDKRTRTKPRPVFVEQAQPSHQSDLLSTPYWTLFGKP